LTSPTITPLQPRFRTFRNRSFAPAPILPGSAWRIVAVKQEQRGRSSGPMVDLLAVMNAVVAGVLLGGFYAAVALGIAIAFGMLDIPNLSHPAFVVAGAFSTWQLNSRLGLDPVVA